MDNWLFHFVFTVLVSFSLANNTTDIPECVSNNDCATDRVCTKQVCVNPCAGVCGANTVCHMTDHVAMCSCSPGHSGHPTLGCSASPDVPGQSGCSGHDHCPASKACILGKCGDPCEGICGNNTSCTVHHHIPACACSKGYYGDPFVSCAPPASGTWPFTPHGKKKLYVEHLKKASWQEAFVICLRNNSMLVSVDNMEELDNIRQLIRQTGQRFGRFWTSGTDLGYEGHYVWASTGKQLSSTSEMWLRSPDEPNNYYNDEHCVEIWERNFPYGGFGLNDRLCQEATNFICEYYS